MCNNARPEKKSCFKSWRLRVVHQLKELWHLWEPLPPSHNVTLPNRGPTTPCLHRHPLCLSLLLLHWPCNSRLSFLLLMPLPWCSSASGKPWSVMLLLPPWQSSAAHDNWRLMLLLLPWQSSVANCNYRLMLLLPPWLSSVANCNWTLMLLLPPWQSSAVNCPCQLLLLPWMSNSAARMKLSPLRSPSTAGSKMLR
jgi:hypothetical protein